MDYQNEQHLELNFDPQTIEHLGISLYSKLPSVLSELISNSWDADSDNVSITFSDKLGAKTIKIVDDGIGMTFDELNNNYLVIGRNRRKSDSTDITPKGRKVIGKKGLGKLSVFGICNIVEVISVKSGRLNHFEMNIEEILRSQQKTYRPKVIYKDQSTEQKSGTSIILKGIRRKTKFNIESLANSLSKKFNILDKLYVSLEENFIKTRVTNELKYNKLTEQFHWILPNIDFDNGYLYSKKVSGKILTLETPIKDTEMRGIYLISRGKLVNEASFFGARDNDQFHNYVTGYLEVDFIDEFENDVISTDRHSLNWEHEETKELQDFLQYIIRKLGNEWKAKRKAKKQEEIRTTQNLDIQSWQSGLASFERDLSERIIDPILENSNIDINQSTKIIGNVIDKFENKTFKEYASHIADISNSDDLPKLLSLLDEWKIVESKQFRDLAVSRIEVIKQFEEYLDSDTKEVPTLHNFLKSFSWLLDPRILEFRDEVTYSRILKENFPEENLEKEDRRIDFLCSNALGKVLYVIEIKRSKYKVDAKAIDQAFDYGAFLKDKYASESGFSKVVCYVVGGEKSSDYRFRGKEDTYSRAGDVFVKTYRELLEQSKEYHKEFLEAYRSNGL